jgi:hypothetical protein
MAPLAVRDGTMSTAATLDDPQLIVDGVGVAVEDLRCIGLRLRVSEGVGSCQTFWSTAAEPGTSADKSLRFALEADGEWHTYQVTKEVSGKWSGVLKYLRFDIGGPGDTIEVDWVRLYGR